MRLAATALSPRLIESDAHPRTQSIFETARAQSESKFCTTVTCADVTRGTCAPRCTGIRLFLTVVRSHSWTAARLSPKEVRFAYAKILGVFWCVLALVLMVAAADSMAVGQEVGQVAFTAPVRVGTATIAAGSLNQVSPHHGRRGSCHDIPSRRWQGPRGEGEMHFWCSWARRQSRRGPYTLSIAANERVLQELVLAGDNQKHVFFGDLPKTVPPTSTL